MIHTREQLKQYCFRQLGSPVIEINMDDLQAEDRIDEAIDYYNMYHFDGMERTYMKYQLTQEDVDNMYIDLPYEVKGVIRIFSLNYTSANSLLNFETQYRLDIIANLHTASLADFQITMNHLQLIDNLLSGQTLLRFNKNNGRLHIDTNWRKLHADTWIVIDCYTIIDPEIETLMYNDMWLKQYTTALFKRQWASNLKKYQGMSLPGGVTIDGQSLYQESIDEISLLEQQLRDEDLPFPIYIG